MSPEQEAWKLPTSERSWALGAKGLTLQEPRKARPLDTAGSGFQSSLCGSAPSSKPALKGAGQLHACPPGLSRLR